MKRLQTLLKEAKRGIFVMATGSRGTPEFMESIAAENGRPAFMVTVLTMYNDAEPAKAMTYYERCAAARARGNEVYIHTSCQPLSFDFTLAEPYLLYSHDAFDRVKAAKPEERAGDLRGSGVSPPVPRKPEESEAGNSFLRRLEQDRGGRRADHRTGKRRRAGIRWTFSSTCRSTRS